MDDRTNTKNVENECIPTFDESEEGMCIYVYYNHIL